MMRPPQYDWAALATRGAKWRATRHMKWAAQGGMAELKVELDRAHRQLDALYYSLSHDLHSPLRTMQEMARILRDEHSQQLSPETAVFLGHLTQGTGKVVARVEGLAQFGRISRQPLSFRTVDIAELVRQLLADPDNKAETGHSDIVMGPLPDATGDAAQLRQLFSSLLDNAFKFSRGRPAPRIEIGGHRDGGLNAYFVADNGVGFDMKYAGKLFGLFQRMHAEAQFAGIGMGLAIARSIVERHGGTIRAEAVKDGGTTLHFTLPVANGSAQPAG
ncbi:MAG: ATP-binding protein [Gammaproteobacteria bacterium]